MLNFEHTSQLCICILHLRLRMVTSWQTSVFCKQTNYDVFGRVQSVIQTCEEREKLQCKKTKSRISKQTLDIPRLINKLMDTVNVMEVVVSSRFKDQLESLSDPWGQDWCLRQASKSNLGILWPWTWTSWPIKLIVSLSCACLSVSWSGIKQRTACLSVSWSGIKLRTKKSKDAACKDDTVLFAVVFVCLFVCVDAITLALFEISLREQDMVRSSDEFEKGCSPMQHGARVLIYVSDVLLCCYITSVRVSCFTAKDP